MVEDEDPGPESNGTLGCAGSVALALGALFLSAWYLVETLGRVVPVASARVAAWNRRFVRGRRGGDDSGLRR